jgi:hypothetical protein
MPTFSKKFIPKLGLSRTTYGYDKFKYIFLQSEHSELRIDFSTCEGEMILVIINPNKK